MVRLQEYSFIFCTELAVVNPKFIVRLEEEITKKEENISAKNPEIFHKLRLGADDDKLVEAIRKMTTQQKNLAKVNISGLLPLLW